MRFGGHGLFAASPTSPASPCSDLSARYRLSPPLQRLPAAFEAIARRKDERTLALLHRSSITAAAVRMSLLRSLVASTSALPASATAACSTSSVRCLATTTPEASSSTSSSRPSGPSMGARWAFAVPKAVKARLPPVVVPRGPDQPKPVCPPKAPLETPAKFIAVIGRGIEKKLKGKIDLETMAWEDLMNWRGKQWYEKGGLETKDRRHVSLRVRCFTGRITLTSSMI